MHATLKNAPAAPNQFLTICVLILALAWLGLLAWKSAQVFQISPAVWGWLLQLDRFGPFSWPLFLTHWLTTFKHLLLTLAFFIAAYGLGISVIPRAVRSRCSRLEEALYALGLGFSFLSLLIFIMGVLGLYLARDLRRFIFALLAWGLWQGWQNQHRLIPEKGRPLRNWKRLDYLLALPVLGFLGLGLVCLNTPELFYDALVYHLGVPAQWLLAHGMKPLPGIYFSNLPMTMEMLYTGALQLGDEKLCRMIHFSMGCLAGLAVYALGRRWFSERAGFWAAGLFLCVPLVSMNMQTAGADVGAAFFGLLGLGWFLAWALAADRPMDKIQPLLAGILVGSALAGKYNNAFMLAPGLMAIAIVAAWQEKNYKRMLRGLLWLGMAVGLVLSPWLVKNAIWTGNPVAPFLYQMIPTKNVVPEKMRNQMLEFREFGKRTLPQYLTLPWDLSFYLPTSNSFINIFFLFLSPGFFWLAWKARPGPPVVQIVLATAGAGLLIWASQTQITRYLIPVIPLLCLLSALVLEQAEKWQSRLGLLGRLGVVGFVLVGLNHTASINIYNLDPAGVSLGLEKPQPYLERRMLTSYAAMADRVNQLPAEAKVLLFGEARSYYFKRPVVAATVFDQQPLLALLSQGASAETAWEELRKQGITHVFVHGPEAARTRGYEPYRWSTPAVAGWNELEARYFRQAAAFQDQVLYEVLSEPRLFRPIKTGRMLFMYDPGQVGKLVQHQQQSQLALQRGDDADYLAQNQRMIALAPDWPKPYQNLGWFYLSKDRKAEAFGFYRKADALGWLDPGAYNNLGVLFSQMRNWPEARQCFKLALEMDPGLETAQKNLQAVEAQ